MMQSIVSISPKSTPPPPPRHHHHHHDMLATRRDINPATYYMQSSPTPRAHRPQRATRPRSLKTKTASSSCMNLLSHAHSNQNEDHHTQETASSSLMDLFSYTASTTFAQQSYFNFFEVDDFHYNEFSHHNEFAVSPNASSSDLYDSVKAQNANNKKRYKHKKMRNNIANYMRYMTMDDGEHSDDNEEGRGRHHYAYDFDHQPNYEPQPALPPQTTFDSVNDIFNMIPNANIEQKDESNISQSIENDGNDTKDTDNEPKGRSFVHKLRELLNDHDIEACSDSDGDAVFESINDICQDLEDKKNKVERYEHQYKDLERSLRQLKRDNRQLKEMNNELENKLHLSSITKDNILQQLNDYLRELLEETRTYNGVNGSIMYKDFKVKLSSMYESLKDLAHDLDEEELQNAVHKLKKGIQDIDFMEHHGVYKRNHLENIIKDLLKDMDIKTSKYETPQYPALVFDEEKEIETDNTLTKYGLFSEECPRVVRIDIDGGWFNKKTRAVIKYRGEVFGRKEADFKWLYKMIEVNGESDVLPDFCKELPHSLWNNNYLIKRKRELNLFLMQCHSLSPIKSGTPYNIFLQQNKDDWKHKRNEFDKIMLQRIKRSSMKQ